MPIGTAGTIQASSCTKLEHSTATSFKISRNLLPPISAQSYLQRAGVAAGFHSNKTGAQLISCLKTVTN